MFELVPQAIPEVILVRSRRFKDDRGAFEEVWREDVCQSLTRDAFVQDNVSWSQHGVLRGLHYQIDEAQGKLVRAVDGEIFDVAVDVRRSSATFGRWVGVALSAESGEALWVPPGFAHGFYVKSARLRLL